MTTGQAIAGVGILIFALMALSGFVNIKKLNKGEI